MYSNLYDTIGSLPEDTLLFPGHEYTVRNICTVLAIHCTHYALYSLYTVLAIHCTRYTLYALYTVLAIHCTRYTLYSLYTVLTIHCTHYTLYSLYTVLTIHCTHFPLHSLSTALTIHCTLYTVLTFHCTHFPPHSLYASSQVSNLVFANWVEPDNKAVAAKLTWAEGMRRQRRSTVPSTLAEEKTYNPFMRVHVSLLIVQSINSTVY
jgi:hypothetical protein